MRNGRGMEGRRNEGVESEEPFLTSTVHPLLVRKSEKINNMVGWLYYDNYYYFRGYTDELSKRLVCVQLSALVRAVGGGNTGEIGYQRLAQLFGVSAQSDVLLPKLDQLIAACGWTETLISENGEKVVQISRNANYEVIACFKFIISHKLIFLNLRLA